MKFIFSEEVKDFSTDVINISGSRFEKLTGSGDTYKLVATPDENYEGNMSLEIDSGAVEDLAGNENDDGYTITQVIDTKSPELNIIFLTGSQNLKYLNFTFLKMLKGLNPIRFPLVVVRQVNSLIIRIITRSK